MTPWARAVRTFTFAVGPVLLGLLSLVQDGLQDVKLTDLEPTAIGLATAVLAALSAFVLAYKDRTATTPLGRALAQTLQVFGSGVVVLAVTDLTEAAGVEFAFAFGTLAVVSLLSGLLTLTQVSAETAGLSPAKE